MPPAEAEERVRREPAAGGLGGVTEHDAAATLDSKRGVERPRAGSGGPAPRPSGPGADELIGRLLPGHVAVHETGEGRAVASPDPVVMFRLSPARCWRR